jgi:hypothetical protein
MNVIKVRGERPRSIWVDEFDLTLPEDEQVRALPPWVWISRDDPLFTVHVRKAVGRGCTVLVPDASGVPLSELGIPDNP